MKHFTKLLVLFFCLPPALAQADLEVNVYKPQVFTKMAVVKMELQNTFTNNIKSTQAAVFLLDDVGKVVGQKSRWICGGPDERPGIASNSKTTFFFVVPEDKPFTKAKVLVTCINFDNGKTANVVKEVKIKTPDDK
jgi:hypothetical protein